MSRRIKREEKENEWLQNMQEYIIKQKEWEKSIMDQSLYKVIVKPKREILRGK